jgi:hypothetical protein
MTGLVTSSTKGIETQSPSPSHLRSVSAAALFVAPSKVVVDSPRHMSPAALSPRTAVSSSSPATITNNTSHVSAPSALPFPSTRGNSEDLRLPLSVGGILPEVSSLSLADLNITGSVADVSSSPHSAASSARSTSSTKDKAAARAEKARMYKLLRDQEEESLRLSTASASQRPGSVKATPEALTSASGDSAESIESSKNHFALPEDSRSLAVLDVLNRQKMAEMTIAAFKGSDSEFFDQAVVDTVCDIRFKSENTFDDSFEIGGTSTIDFQYHPQVLMVMSYKDFVEERRDLRRYVWPDIVALVNDFGYAFRPIDPWIGCTSDAAAFSSDCMRDALDGTVSSQFWLFLFGSTYGYVPPLNVMSACSKKFPWYDAFR